MPSCADHGWLQGHQGEGERGPGAPRLQLTLLSDMTDYGWLQGHQSEGERVPGASRPQLTLLSDISGAFRPGHLTCLMGVSGAGKTTLMDVLAGRKTGGASWHPVLNRLDERSKCRHPGKITPVLRACLGPARPLTCLSFLATRVVCRQQTFPSLQADRERIPLPTCQGARESSACQVLPPSIQSLRDHSLRQVHDYAGGLIRGTITVDGHPKVAETFCRVASYVEQVCLCCQHSRCSH